MQKMLENSILLWRKNVCVCLQVSLQEISSRSIYNNLSKNRAKLLPVFGHFSSEIMNDLSMTSTSRLKVDAKCVYQQWNWITVGNYFETPPADWVHGSLYFDPGKWIWTQGSDVVCILWKTDLEIFHAIQSGYVPLDELCLEFWGDFSHCFDWGLWGKSFIENT